MAMYYYARKLQKGSKVSQPCSYTSSSSTGRSAAVQQHQQQHGTLTRINPCCNQQILPPPPPPSRLMSRPVRVACNTQVQCHPHPHHHCHHHSHSCCQVPTHSCCGCSFPVQKQCPCHENRVQKLNASLSHSRSLRSLEHLELNGSSNGSPSLTKRPIPLHPPCCSMLHRSRSESQYDNVDGSPLEELEDHYHHNHHHQEMYKYGFEDDVGKDQGESHREEETGEEGGGGCLPHHRNANSEHQNHLQIRLQNSTSTSTLTEDQFQFQEGNDDDLDQEIQEIYAGKREVKKGLVGFQENYHQNSPTTSRQRNLMQEAGATEEEDHHSLCYNQKGQLISASWDALLERVVIPWVEDDGSSNLVDSDEVMEAFLLCSRLHNPPHLTIAFIFKHFSTTTTKDKPSPNGTHQIEPCYQEEEEGSAGGLDGDLQVDELNLRKDRLHQLARFVRFWTELLPQDFSDDRLMQYVRTLTRVCMDEESEVREEVSTLWTNLVSKLTALEAFETTLRRYKTESLIGEPIAAPSVITISPSPLVLAQQLTLVELEHFSFLGAQELVAQLLRKDRSRNKDYSKTNGSVPYSRTLSGRCSTIGTAYQEKNIQEKVQLRDKCCGDAVASSGNTQRMEAETFTRNLDSFISWFRRLAMYVCTEICKMSKKKSRVRVIEYWIQVGKECFKIRNFNSLLAILGGFSCGPVSRLKKTWSKVNCADLIELQTAMDPKNNFSAYRTMYKTAMWNSLAIPQGESHNYKILVPYFALLLRDVYNLNSIYPSKIKSNNHINFEKYTSMTKLIKEIMSWQNVECPFTKIPSIFNSVQALPVYTEEEVTCASYACEAPDSSVEKEHFNRLKRDQGQRIAPFLSNKGSSPAHYLI
ncbi:ras-GEF domain-containing family member 1B isoform X2 [Folsomia candida]|uniref:ras-GEF domain-containing family member 1B isoform X2 n=1 Tax=Folsomia candida TaxID=158441 RepID=UPI001605038B|nr:ras-GEF domain-containing family member 1B isoform X2 [Folsomia candida]